MNIDSLMEAAGILICRAIAKLETITPPVDQILITIIHLHKALNAILETFEEDG